ncbi:MAG: AMP-binding protein [Desulfatiglans sp.]|nr:AMP-binding protein [Thermodesulfobacteriota bacterium]MEE4352329.1 AMP-binding protein [Desulfatiglans sp.]
MKRNLTEYGDRVAMRKKTLGIWQEYTWQDVYHHVENIALGFSSLGAEKGTRVIIIGNNDPELVWAQWGAQHARLIASCLYVDYLPEEVKYFINDCEPLFVVCEDQEQVDKILAIKEQCPSIQKVIYWDPKGLWSYDEPFLMSLEALESLGASYKESHPDLLEQNRRHIRPDDVAVIVYTSGTTGNPKGNMQTYLSVLEYGREGARHIGLEPWDEYLSYASPAWAEQIVGLSICPIYPLVMSFAEEPETVMVDLREIAPHFVWFGGRQWEDIARQIRVGIEETPFWKRKLFQWALKISSKRLTFIEEAKKVPLYFRAAHSLGDFSVLRKTRDYFGMNRTRCCGSGGALTSPELPRFFKTVGIPFSNLYGTVETGMLTTSDPNGTNYETIGKANPGKSLKIEEGQIWTKVGKERPGYWNNPGKWEENLKDGWFATGDSGWMDDEGNIYYIDRIAEMLSLKSGYHFSPQFIETRLRFNPYIKDAIIFGADQEYVTAIISCDFGMVGRWAESHHIPYTTLVEMSQLPQVLQLLREQIIELNKTLAPETHIAKFVSLHKEFDPDEAELTRSRKLKRGAVGEKYGELIKAMYGNEERLTMETDVSYKDGRKAKIETKLSIIQVDEIGKGPAPSS